MRTFALIASLLAAGTASAQTSLNLSQDLVPLGIAARNMTPNQPAQDAGPLFMQGVAYAKSQGIHVVVADPGSYYFLSVIGAAHVAVAGIDNITIDLHGADLIFTQPGFPGLSVSNSSNATLQNFTVDYDPLPFTQLRVVSVDSVPGRVRYTVEPGWQDPSSFNAVTVPAGGPPPTYEVHTFRSGRPAPGVRRMATQPPFNGDTLQLAALAAPVTVGTISPGDVMVLATRAAGAAIGTDRCHGCAMRNITVYSSAGGDGAVLGRATQFSLFERIYARPKSGTDRLVSTFSAAVVGFDGPNNTIRLSRGIRTMDDAFRFQGRVIGTILSQPAGNKLTIGPAGASSVLGAGDSVPNGSPVTLQAFSTAVVVAGNVVASANIVAQTAPASQQVTFTLDREVPGYVGLVMYTTDSTQNGANSRLERSTAQNQSLGASGATFAGLADSIARGNYMSRTAFAALNVTQTLIPGFPLTAPPANLTVANNVVDGTNITTDQWWFELGAIQAAALDTSDLLRGALLQNITVANNFISDAGRSGVWISNTTTGSVTGNYVRNAKARPDLENARYHYMDLQEAVKIDGTATAITAARNIDDTTSKRLFVTDSQYRELAAYAPGASIQLNALNLGALSNPTVTITDADGATTPVILQSSSTHAVRVQLPPLPSGGAFITVSAGAAKYFGTLFVDDQDNDVAVNGCTYELSPAATSLVAAASTLDVLVVTQAGCSYQATSTSSVVTPGSGATGTAVITVALAANLSYAREVPIEIAGTPFTVTQADGPCIFMLTGAVMTLPTQGGTGTATVSVGSGCSWSTTNSNWWFTLSPTSGVGPGPVTVTAGPAFSSGRQGEAMVAGYLLHVSQYGGPASPPLFGGPGEKLAHVKFVPFKFNSDAWTDLLFYNEETGAFMIKVGTQPDWWAFSEGPTGFWAPGWNISRADFNGDGLDDLFLYSPVTGVFFKVINAGDNTFRYFTQGWAAGFNVSIVDFDGDGKSDVFVYNPATGDWYTCISAGDGTTGFTYRHGVWAAGYEVLPADFNGDGHSDLFLYNHLSGLYYKAIGQGDGTFTYPTFGVWARTWTPYILDLNGDGHSDVFLYDKSGGAYYRSVSTGDGTGGFAYTSGTWAPGWQVQIADFDGDSRADLFLYNPITGVNYKAINTGTDFAYALNVWGKWTTTIMDLNGDGKSDVMLIDPVRGFWCMARTVGPGGFEYFYAMFN